MGNIWILVPILPIFLAVTLAVFLVQLIVSAISNIGNVEEATALSWSIAQFFALYGLGIVSFYLMLLLGSVAFFYLIDRRNAHFKRQQQLFLAISKYLSSIGKISPSVSLSRLSQIAEESVFDEDDRPAGLWAILYLFVTPIVGIIVAYNLIQDLQSHEERQAAYLQTLPAACNDAGIAPMPLGPYTPHRSELILFVILTAITGGLFWIYWFYRLLADYNEHFRVHAQIEDLILTSLRPTPPANSCARCGGSVPQNARFCPFCGAQQLS